MPSGNTGNSIQAWKTKFQEASSIPEKAELWKELGLMYRDQESNLKNAIEAFQQAIRLYDDETNREKDATTHNFPMASLHFQLGQTYCKLWCETSEDKYSQCMLDTWEQSKELCIARY